MEPILLKFDEGRYTSDMTRLVFASKAFTPLFSQIVKLSGIELTQELVTELFQSNDPVKTLQAVKDKVVTSLESAGLRIKAIRDASITQAAEDFWKIFNKITNTRSTYAGLPLYAALHWNGTELQVSETFAIEYKERFSTYVKTEDGESLR